MQKSIKSLYLAIDPSSFIISQITPEGFEPDNLAKSTAASVWPALTKTPPFFATRGKICLLSNTKKNIVGIEGFGLKIHDIKPIIKSPNEKKDSYY